MIEEYISQKGLIKTILTPTELLNLSHSKKECSMMMGQTFSQGQPLDMMKYALFMMDIQDFFAKKDTPLNSTWLIADHFMTDINKDKTFEETKKQVKERISYLEKLNKVYNGNINFILSSKLSQLPEYQEHLKKLKKEASENPRFKAKVLEAIPEDRRNNPNAINYPLEELATIATLKTNIKIGPTYEIFYDAPAREFAPMIGINPYIAIHLTNVFPLGNPTLTDALKNQIQKFGVLPYKLDSKGLTNYRIDPINDSPEKIERLITETQDQKALNNLTIISQLARSRIQADSNLAENQNRTSPQNFVLNIYKKYIQTPLQEKK